MPDPDKKMLREIKRIVKRRGNKHRRQQLKIDLIKNPEEAHLSEEQLGKCRSEEMNNIDGKEIDE